ncbi:MAG: response regulator [Thermoanaerobaculia bacterium]|nr:response regulator [Thermoanaerobaculia bacterium]
MKLLIVDDSSIVRRTIERQLELGGISEVLQAGNGREAIELFRRHLPDFVTMDITMPEVDGLTCVTEIMAIKPDTKLMVISALGDSETAIEAVERGANEYVYKPFSAEDLNTALRNLLGAPR